MIRSAMSGFFLILYLPRLNLRMLNPPFGIYRQQDEDSLCKGALTWAFFHFQSPGTIVDTPTCEIVPGPTLFKHTAPANYAR